MDTKNFIDVLVNHIEYKQVVAILNDFKDADPPVDYCVVCGVPTQVSELQHAENCPVLLLQQYA